MRFAKGQIYTWVSSILLGMNPFEIRDDLFSAEVKKEYAEKRLAEKKEGGNGWKAQRWKQDVLERACISITKSNYEMLRCHCTAPDA